VEGQGESYTSYWRYTKITRLVYIAAVQEVIDRAKQDAARSGDDLSDGGSSNGIDHKDGGGSEEPRGGGRKGGKPVEGSTGSDGTVFMAVHEIAAKVCLIHVSMMHLNQLYMSENSGICPDMEFTIWWLRTGVGFDEIRDI